MNTAAMASLYVIVPLPWNPTTEYVSWEQACAEEAARKVQKTIIELTYALRPRPGASPTGKFARAPMRVEASAETAAVVVMKSR